ncbi:MAG: hypothetical protein JO021_25520 [Alphaproteobacteria bacterium]|nr:hypothetical protein [Alphaproteobacteria bacterium]
MERDTPLLPARPGWPLAARPARVREIDVIVPFAGARARWTTPALGAIALLVALLPLAVASLPPLTDYPFHTARITILQHWHDWPGLQAFYDLRSFLLPNIAMDAILLAAVQVLPIDVAGRAFVALTMAAMLSGTVALHWSLHRRFSPWPLVAAVFLHNWIFVFGFFNYLFGFGLTLWGLAIWILLAERPPWQRLVVGSVVAITIYFAHLVAFGLYAIMLGAYELQRALPLLRRRFDEAAGRLLVGALPFVPPLAVFVLLSETSREAGDRIKYQDWYWKGFVVARTFMSMNLGLDLLTAGVLLVVAIALLLRGRLTFAREMLLGIVLVAATFIAIPWKTFGAVFVDARFPVALIFLVIACSDVGFSRVRLGRAVFVLFGALLVIRSVVLAGDWMQFDKTLGRMEQAVTALPENSVILSATAAPLPRTLPEWVDRWRPPLIHAASLAQRHKAMFAVNTWATPSQQPIAVTPPWEPLYRFQEQNPMPVESTATFERFVDRARSLIERAHPGQPTYLILLYPEYLRYDVPRGLTRIDAGDRFILYRVEP